MVLMILFAGQESRHRCREWTCGHDWGRREWDDLSSTEIYTLPCVNWIASMGASRLQVTGDPP